MKKLLPLVLISIFACKKNSNGNSSGPASVLYSQYYNILSSSGSSNEIINDPTNLNLQVLPRTNKSGNALWVELVESKGSVTYGVDMQIDSIGFNPTQLPLNVPLSKSGLCTLELSSTASVSGVDSNTFVLVITRSSNGTVDGNFSFNIGSGADTASVVNGIFKNIPFHIN